MYMRAFFDLNRLLKIGSIARRVFLSIFAVWSTAFSLTFAQGVTEAPLPAPSSAKLPHQNPNKSSKILTTPSITTKPDWKDLTPDQQQSLKPLTAKWSTLEEPHKRKWLAIAASYPTLAPAEQAKIHSRMTEWVSLSQQQRAQARLNFARSKQLTPIQKTATWEAYQALSPEEKHKLAILATPKPVGAAAAAKPVPTHKLAVVPMSRQSPKQIQKSATAINSVNKNTLLPHSLPPAQPASAQ